MAKSLPLFFSWEAEKFFLSAKKVSDGKDVAKEDLAKDELLKSISGLSSFEVGSFVYYKFVKKSDDIFEKKMSQKKKADKKG